MSEEAADAEPGRQVFSSLKTHGAKHKVAVERVSNKVLGGPGKVSSVKAPENASAPSFQIFSVSI